VGVLSSTPKSRFLSFLSPQDLTAVYEKAMENQKQKAQLENEKKVDALCSMGTGCASIFFSMSERKGEEMPTFFANSRRDRSALSRSS
jgi:hypothetical protein